MLTIDASDPARYITVAFRQQLVALKNANVARFGEGSIINCLSYIISLAVARIGTTLPTYLHSFLANLGSLESSSEKISGPLVITGLL